MLTRLQVAFGFSLFALGYFDGMVELSLHIVQGLLKSDQMLIHRLNLCVSDSKLIVAEADDFAEPFSFLVSLDDFAFQQFFGRAGKILKLFFFRIELIN